MDERRTSEGNILSACNWLTPFMTYSGRVACGVSNVGGEDDIVGRFPGMEWNVYAVPRPCLVGSGTRTGEGMLPMWQSMQSRQQM